VGLLVALVTVVAGSGPAPSSASPTTAGEAPHDGACQHPDGVTVVVSFAAFGGGTEVRCAGWPVSTGYDALRRAGFAVTDTQRYPGLLCRIDGVPADQACVVAPPATAYWGYWHAERGGGWTYSSQGAGTRRPPAGSVEGWAFGRDARPGGVPAELPPATTTSTTARPPVADPAPQPAVPGSTPTRPASPADDGPTTTAPPGGTDGQPAPVPDDEPSGPEEGSTAPEPSLGAASSDEAAASLEGLAPSSASGAGDAGSPVAALATAGTVLAVGLAAATQARRRRRSEAP
jgi:hypothetical protein